MQVIAAVELRESTDRLFKYSVPTVPSPMSQNNGSLGMNLESLNASSLAAGISLPNNRHVKSNKKHAGDDEILHPQPTE